MFMIKCSNCGREQQWTEGVVVGQGTEIEIANKAIYCTCGEAVEEENGVLVSYRIDTGTDSQLLNKLAVVREFNVEKNPKENLLHYM